MTQAAAKCSGWLSVNTKPPSEQQREPVINKKQLARQQKLCRSNISSPIAPGMAPAKLNTCTAPLMAVSGPRPLTKSDVIVTTDTTPSATAATDLSNGASEDDDATNDKLTECLGDIAWGSGFSQRPDMLESLR